MTASPVICSYCLQPIVGISWIPYQIVGVAESSSTECNACHIARQRSALSNGDVLAITAERDRLRAFAARIIEEYCWDYHDPDGGDIQDLAVTHGIIVPTPHDLETCTVESCPGCEYETDMLYRLTWTVTP